MDQCQNCLEPVFNEYGVLELNNDGLCEACADAERLGRIMDEEERGLPPDFVDNDPDGLG
jgi:hypothetical protein